MEKVITFENWEVALRFLIEKPPIPFIEQDENVIVFNSSKTKISININNLDISPEVLNKQFEVIFAPKGNINLCQLLGDIKRLRRQSQAQILILIDSSNESKDTIMQFIKTTLRFLKDISIYLITDKKIPLGELSDVVHRGNVYLGDISVNDNQMYSTINYYKHNGIAIEGKKHNIRRGKNQLIQELTTPVYISKGTVDQQLLTTYNWLTFANTEELNAELDQSTHAVVIFKCEQYNDIKKIAELILTTKNRHGKNLKILVRECEPCIRYRDFHLLCRAGAQAIINHTTSNATLFDQVELAKHINKPSEQWEFADLLLQYETDISESGVLSSAAFIEQVTTIFHRTDRALTECALVKLVPFSALKTKEILTHSNIKRRGDIMTTLNGHILVYFSSLRPHEVTQALRSVFTININELFAEHTVATNPTDMQAMISDLSMANNTHDKSPYKEQDMRTENHTYAPRSAMQYDWEQL